MNRLDLKNFLKKYRWWFIFGTIAVIITFYIYAEFDRGWLEDAWLIYTIFIICGFLGELFTKPIKFYFIINTICFSIFQSFLWLIIWALYLVISGEMYEPSPLPKILIIPWTFLFSIYFVFPSNFIGSFIANIVKRIIKKYKEG